MRRRRYRRATRTRRTGRRRTFGRPLARQNGFTRRAGYYGRYHAAFAANVPAFQQKVELKFKDTNLVSTNISNIGSIPLSSLNIIPQGTGENNRIGRNVLVTKLMFKGELELQSQVSTTDAHDIVRIIVYWDQQTNGAPAVVLDVLESLDINAFRNLANSKRFKILYDKKYVMNTGAATVVSSAIVTAPITRNVNYYINMRMPVEFNSTAGTIDEIKSNNLGVIYISKHVNITQIKGKFRIRYTG